MQSVSTWLLSFAKAQEAGGVTEQNHRAEQQSELKVISRALLQMCIKSLMFRSSAGLWIHGQECTHLVLSDRLRNCLLCLSLLPEGVLRQVC